MLSYQGLHYGSCELHPKCDRSPLKDWDRQSHDQPSAELIMIGGCAALDLGSLNVCVSALFNQQLHCLLVTSR